MEYSNYYFKNKNVRLPNQRVNIDLNGNSGEPNSMAPAFTITNLEDNYLGHIHFNYINERHGTFSLGMLITEGERGKGYGKAAMELLIKYAFVFINKCGGIICTIL